MLTEQINDDACCDVCIHAFVSFVNCGCFGERKMNRADRQTDRHAHHNTVHRYYDAGV